MNFELKGSAHKLRTDIVLADRDTHELFTDKMRYIFIELPAFTKEEDDCENDFERWIYVLKNMETLQRLPFKARSAVFQRLEEIVDIASLTKEERMRYDESLKVYRDNLAVREFNIREGFEKGMKKGMEKGMKKGMEKGREKGRAEERIKIAHNLKAAGVSTEIIAKTTGLTTEEIESL